MQDNADEIIRILESDTSIDEIIIVESENVREFTEKLNILKDKNHRIVDDCIGATVGGANNYLRILKSVSDAGTYLFTPMYSKGWKELLQLDKLHRDPSKALELVKKTHEMVGYKRVAKINTGLEYTENFDASIREFAELFDFEILEFNDGNQEIFEDCYNEFKLEIGTGSSC